VSQKLAKADMQVIYNFYNPKFIKLEKDFIEGRISEASFGALDHKWTQEIQALHEDPLLREAYIKSGFLDTTGV
jgi:hypothetical protein